jgi:hypothetical protein
MELRDRAYQRGREIGSTAFDTNEADALVAAFVQFHPGADAMLDTLWKGISATNKKLGAQRLH